MRHFALLALLLAASLTFAQDAKKKEAPTVASVLNGNFSGLESELVPAVEAMPEDKFNFAPTAGEFKGVRTFALQARHIATVNYEMAAAILGEKMPVDTGANENGTDSLKTKAQVVQYLKDSFVYAHKAIATVTAENQLGAIKSPFGDGETTRLSMAMGLTWHGFDHYGQIVEYLRLNSIIPPASR
jgi:hypothetical protein